MLTAMIVAALLPLIAIGHAELERRNADVDTPADCRVMRSPSMAQAALEPVMAAGGSQSGAVQLFELIEAADEALWPGWRARVQLKLTAAGG
jgi:hypothetical protein